MGCTLYWRPWVRSPVHYISVMCREAHSFTMSLLTMKPNMRGFIDLTARVGNVRPVQEGKHKKICYEFLFSFTDAGGPYRLVDLKPDVDIEGYDIAVPMKLRHNFIDTLSRVHEGDLLFVNNAYAVSLSSKSLQFLTTRNPMPPMRRSTTFSQQPWLCTLQRARSADLEVTITLWWLPRFRKVMRISAETRRLGRWCSDPFHSAPRALRLSNVSNTHR